MVRFIRTPEDAARQGRTQVYQSIARAAGKPARRRRSTAGPDQTELFDELIEEVERVDESVGIEVATDDEEVNQ